MSRFGLVTSLAVISLAVVGCVHAWPISDCGDRILNDGYPMERHTVTTKDGYILTMHRIPYSPNTGNNGKRPVAFLMHGMLSSSSDWVLMGPGKALAYILADSGYDVWMGNARGNTYSKKHTVWPTFWPIFWNFSWNEIGVYDVPAMIDYALDVTGEAKVQYIGHSQGTTVYLVMMSEKPSYNDKIKSAHLMGPAAYMGNMKSPMTRALAPLIGQPNALGALIGSTEFAPSNKFLTSLGILQCQAKSPFVELCANSVFLIGGYDSDQLDRNLLEDISATSPSSASVNQNVHFSQENLSGKFRKFDYGIVGNQYKYGRISPPNYKISNAKAPVMLYYGANDWMCDVGDVQRLRDELPNVKLDYLVPFPKWAHLDFVWGKDAKKYVYAKVLEQLAQYE